MTLPTLTAEQLAGLTDDEILAAFGGEERAREIVRVGLWHEYAQQAAKHLLDFTRFTMPDPNHPQDAEHSRFKVAAHHKLMADALMDVFEGRCMKLALSIPPQHGKSELASRRGLAYHVGRWPWKNLLMATYNGDFAKEFGDDVRNIMQSEEFGMVFPGVRLRKGSKAKDHMVTEEHGGKLSFLGREGSATGRPADGLLIDDPFKNRLEAESKIIRDQVWGFFTAVANTRCHVLTWQIIIQTRWHEDDLIGRLTDPKNPHYDEHVAKQWTVLNIPAIVEDEELAGALGLAKGSALWTERFPLSVLETARRMDPYNFSALYMGRPTPPEGAFYKQSDLHVYQSVGEIPLNASPYITGDLAVSPEKDADKSCVGLWLVDENDTLWLHPDLFWEKVASDQAVEAIIDKIKIHGPLGGFFEKGQIANAIGPFLDKRMTEESVTLNIDTFPTTGSKGSRSLSIRGRMRQGKVRFPAFAPWWSAAKEELLKFTGSGNDTADDFCDMLAQIGLAMDEHIPASRPAKPTNVIKVGSMAWVKKAHNDELKRKARLQAIGGM